MNIKNTQFTSIEQITGTYLNKKTATDNTVNNSDLSFEQILQESFSTAKDTQELKFSKHAGLRLAERNITLSKEQLQRLEDGALRAGEKGIKESLVLMDNYAFIVNTTNKTVITAMDPRTENENIYTNIDGAVVI